MTKLVERYDWKPPREIDVEPPYPKHTAQYMLWRELQRTEAALAMLDQQMSGLHERVVEMRQQISVATIERDSIKAALEKLGGPV